ncbi:hypothetical protein KIH23_06745 [Flavobacterium sp. CYK-55]|uniref:hypothetical protein n=1 Tax=Flavobacterium sp. CYK-55 TaxID=2835529 RepID=UPI001BCB3F47|nr:hypothetical protein [Flavobacterium sp. CYK-55]MBS7786989.1 hypothetical protein [Flavobacterium sp. CYK-55]
MGLFGNNFKKIIHEFRIKSQDYSNDLSNEIQESLEDLKSEYDQYHESYPELVSFLSQIKNKLSTEEHQKLEALLFGLRHIDHCAQNGVHLMRDLYRHQRKTTRETLRLYEEFDT